MYESLKTLGLSRVNQLATKQRHSLWNWLKVACEAMRFLVPVFLGLGLGGIVLLALSLPVQWKGLIILATMVPTVALLANNMKGLVLIFLVVDMPLGLDIALGHRPGHRGGVAGFLISLMTIAMGIGYALWLLNRSTGNKLHTYIHKDIVLPATIYLFILLISAFQAKRAWFSFTQLFLEIQFLFAYFYIVNHVRTWASVRLMFTTLALCVLCESVLMFLQYFMGVELSAFGISSGGYASNIASANFRSGGTLISPNIAATYLAASLVIIFSAYLTDGWIIEKKLALVTFLLGAVALMTTQSRSGWIAFMVAMLIVIVRALMMNIGTNALIALFIVAMVLGVGFSRQIVDRFVTDDKHSAESRIWQSKLAFNIIEANMFTGIGLNNLWYVMDDYLPLELIGEPRYPIHNGYLAIWVGAGLFALLSFVWLLLSGVRRALRALMHTKDTCVSITITGLLAALIACMVHMLSATFMGRARLQLVWFILTLIAATSQIVEEAERFQVPIAPSKKFKGTGSDPALKLPLVTFSLGANK